MKFYTLLYVDEKNKSLSHNGISGNFGKQIQIYQNCCKKLNDSLMLYNYNVSLTVLTNSEQVKKEIIGCNVEIIPFSLNVPKGIRFFAAHYKIDVINWLSQVVDEYSVLIDNDIICLNKVPINLVNIVTNNIPTYFDISDQVYPAYGREIIIEDKIKLDPCANIGIWAGGEYVGGDREFFKKLHHEISLILDKYLKTYASLHHQGDEMLISVAIEKMIKRREAIINIGGLGIIGRYWSVDTKHCQKPIDAYRDHFLLHIPDDKQYISKIDAENDLFENYKKYLRFKKRVSMLKKIMKFFIKKRS